MPIYTINDRQRSATSARNAAMVALAMGILCLCALPLAPICALLGLAPTTFVAWSALRVYWQVKRERQDLVRRWWFKLPVDAVPAGPTQLYVGEGANWRESDREDGPKHRTKWTSIFAKAADFDPAEYRDVMADMAMYPAQGDGFLSVDDAAARIASAEKGDPRLLGVVAEQMGSKFLDASILTQHTMICGSTGVGKTRVFELYATWAAQNGWGCFYIDPKGDADMRDLLYHLARLTGRPFVSVDLYDVLHSDSYNPFVGWKNPAELLSRAKALISDNPSQPFWSEMPTGSAGGMLVVQGWCKLLIEAIGSTADIVSPVHQAWAHALAAANGGPVTVEHVEAGWAASREEPLRADPNTPAYLFTADGLTPSLETLYNLTVDNCRTLLAWAARAIHPELFGDLDPWKIDEWEATKTEERQQQNAEAPPVRLRLERYLLAPIPLNGESWATAQPEPIEGVQPTAPEVVEALWAPLADKASRIRDIIEAIQDNCRRQAIPWAARPTEERQRYCSSLQAATSAYVDRYKLVSAPRPALDLRRIISEGGFAMIALQSMSLGASAEALGKMLIADIMGYCGRVNAGEETKRPFLLMSDELAAFCSGQLIRLAQQSRSAGCGIVGGCQSPSGLLQGCGSQSNLDDLMNNVRTRIQLQATAEKEQAEAAKLFGKVTISEFSRNVGVNPSIGSAGNDFNNLYAGNQGVNETSKEVELVPPAAFEALPAGAFFAAVAGGTGPILCQAPQITLPADQPKWSEILRSGRPMEEWHVALTVAAGLPLPKWHVEATKRQKAGENSINAEAA